MSDPYTIIIGLEVHVQLLTTSKMFCGCGTKFGLPPNTQTCPVCIGMPGSLPVMNRKAFELALKTAVALNCEIPHFTKWDRKNYYYPDLPKGYQISQFDLPLSRNGWLEIETASPLPLGEGSGVRADASGQWPVASGQTEGTENAKCKLQIANCKLPPSNPQSPIPNPSAASPHPSPLPKGEGAGRKRIRILRAHLEEDAGKSMHDEGRGGKGDSPHLCEAPGGPLRQMGTVHFSAGKADSRIDLNRAGTPLLEIVSQPDIRSPMEAKTYLTELKLLLNYLGVSDCNMQEGSLRVDANINLHIREGEKGVRNRLPEAHGEPGEPSDTTVPDTFFAATPIVEVKNMNSFRAVERALAYEAQRQWQEWQETGHRLGEVPKATRGWDEASQTTRLQRTKEESSDYRYFPDPDLVPVTVTDEEIDRVRASLGVLPAALRTRLEQTYGITPYDAEVLVNQGWALVDYYIAVADACGDGKAASNWIQQDVLRWLGERQTDIAGYPVAPGALAELIGKVRSGAFETGRGREVLSAMTEGKSLAEAIDALGIAEVDDSALVALCRKLVAANPKIAAEVRDGKLKGLGALIGQAKKENPNVNANRVRELCLKMIQTGED
jgi:aspartyl-tRNA(Asn)/glutamyl-tRNA(Gln) amidotransferase subunit B